MKPLRVGLVGYDDVTVLDLIGPMEAFFSAQVEDGSRQRPGYEVLIVGGSGRPFVAESGAVVKPHCSVANAPRFDTLIVPGGPGLRQPATTAWVSDWILSRAKDTRRIASVCTGIYGIAPTGLLDGRRVTTHWRFADDVRQRFPRLIVDAAALYTEDAPFYTSAGVTAGIDLSLALIEADYGARVALAVARELVVYVKRPGGQDQFSEPLRFQTQSADAFNDLGNWIISNLGRPMTVATLARRSNLSVRQFNRKFKEVFSMPPATFIEEMRLAEASRRLTTARASVKRVAAAVGFRSSDAFRRAFHRRFGVPPSDYRERFAKRGA